MRCIFPPVVGTQNFNLGRKLGLSIGMKFFENRECFIFRAQKINPSETSIVINKSDEVFVSSMGYNRCNPL